MRTTLGFASAIALTATCANAADPSDWTGPYIGGNIGVAFLSGDATIFRPVFGGALNANLSDTGVTFGGGAGYNFQMDNFLFGIEGDFNYLDVKDSFTFANKATDTLRADYDWFATLRGRAGLTVEDSLFYATGGVAFIDSELHITDNFNGATGRSSEVLTGFAVGGGYERKFSDAWSAKVEYLYMNFERDSVSAGIVSAATVEPELHVVRVGVNFNFCTGGRC